MTEQAAASPGSSRQIRIVAIANQKGGVGKTTTAINLGAALAMVGRQVLIVDLDPQGNATTGLGVRAADGSDSIYGVLIGRTSLAEIVAPTVVDNLFLAPSSIDLAGAELEMVSMLSRERRLASALAPVARGYDAILVDCAPSLSLLTINALVAAQELLIPVQCEYYALEGLGQLMDSIELIRSSINDDLYIGGVLLTMFDGRTKLSADVAGQIRSYFGERVYRTVIPRSVRLAEAPSYGEPIEVYDRMSAGAVAYRHVATEFLKRHKPQEHAR